MQMAGAGQTLPHGRPASPLARAALAVLPVAAAGFLGNLATTPAIPTWYAGLAKPWFTPPNWVFGPVWTLLYLMMAYAAWRVLSVPGDRPGRTGALTAFYVQLALNAAWSWAFFGLRSPGLGLLVIAGLLVMIVVTILRFRPLDKVAAWLLVPYLAWVAYASALNTAIWRINP
jgi:tryptophan-rich sensory protein